MQKEKPVLMIPQDVVDLATAYFGKNKFILPAIHKMVQDNDTTWSAVRAAITNLQNGRLKFTYIRQVDPETGIQPKNGATIVFELPQRKNNTVLNISIAWCNPNDTFNPKLGRLLAAIDYVHDRKTMIRLPMHGKYSSQLKDMFNPCVNNCTLFNQELKCTGEN